MWELLAGDCVEVMRGLEPNSVDAIVCDPPYGLRFMGKAFDTLGDGIAQQEWHRVWLVEAERVLKPGGRLLAFGGTRTYHRLMLAVGEAQLVPDGVFAWCYGSGFPKSLDVSKAIDKASGVERENKFADSFTRRAGPSGNKKCEVCDKWLVSGSPCQCPRPQDVAQSEAGKQWQGWGTALKPAWEPVVSATKPGGTPRPYEGPRFLYCPKANKRERNAGLDSFEIKRPDERTATGMGSFEEKGVQPQRNHHPTVKPIGVMRWLIQAASEQGETVLDPFTGSGTTGCAAILENRVFVGVEREAEYLPLAHARLTHWDQEQNTGQMALTDE